MELTNFINIYFNRMGLGILENNFTLKDLLHLIRKKWLLFIFIPLLFAGISAYISYQIITPTYEARVDLLVNNTVENEDNQLTAMDIETNLQLIETYQFIIKSDYILDKVRHDNADSLTNEALKKKMRIETNNNSQIISLYVQDNSLQQSVTLANAIATTIRDEVKTLMNIENIKILTYAADEKHLNPIAPKPFLFIFLSFSFGLLIVTLYIFLTTYFQMRISSKEDIEKFLQLPVFGMVSKIKYRSKNEANQQADPLSMQPRFMQTAPEIVEAFRIIRTNIQFQSTVSQLKSIVVTSPAKNEGKTTIVQNLATLMAIDHKKTVMIDADFRNKPVNQSTASRGLSTYLTNQHSIEEIISDTSVRNLKMIYSGPTPPMSTELLSSTEMNILLDELKKTFDFIIIDSPPLLLADAAILATKTDGCLLVARSDKTKLKHMHTAVEQLKQVNASILGVVLNHTKSRKNEIREYNNGNRWKKYDQSLQAKTHP